MNRMVLRPQQRLPLSLWIYRALLVLYPSDYRREYGPHMLQVFGDCLRDAHTQGGAYEVMHLWTFTLFDLFKTALEERSRQRIRLTKRTFVRLSGLAAMLGGVLWIAIIVTLASRPPGIPGRHREVNDLLAEILFALLLIVGGLAGAHTRQFSHSRWWGLPGVVAIVSAVLFFSLSQLAGIWQFDVFFIGYVLLILGSVLSGGVMLAGRALPRWATPFLIVGSLVLLGFNSDDARAYLALPFGAAAIVLGFALLLDKRMEPST